MNPRTCLLAIHSKLQAMTQRQVEITRLASLPSYLSEISILAGRRIKSDELLSVQETESLRSKLKQMSKERVARGSISFEKIRSGSFISMIEQLYNLNGSPVVLWPPKANDCGLFQMTSIKHVNFDIPFDLNPEGILLIATRDGLDSLLLDFSEDDGCRSLEIELRGRHWSSVTPPNE